MGSVVPPTRGWLACWKSRRNLVTLDQPTPHPALSLIKVGASVSEANGGNGRSSEIVTHLNVDLDWRNLNTSTINLPTTSPRVHWMGYRCFWQRDPQTCPCGGGVLEVCNRRPRWQAAGGGGGGGDCGRAYRGQWSNKVFFRGSPFLHIVKVTLLWTCFPCRQPIVISIKTYACEISLLQWFKERFCHQKKTYHNPKDIPQHPYIPSKDGQPIAR